MNKALSCIIGTHACAAKLDGRTSFGAFQNLRFRQFYGLKWYITDYPELARLQNLHEAIRCQRFPSGIDIENAYVIAIPIELYSWFSARTFEEVTTVLGAYYGLLASNEPGDAAIVCEQVLPEFHAPLEYFRKRVSNLNSAISLFEREFAPPHFLRHYVVCDEGDEGYLNRQPVDGEMKEPFVFDVRLWGISNGDEDQLDGFSRNRHGERVRLNKGEAIRAQADVLDRCEADPEAFQYLAYARNVKKAWKIPIGTSLPVFGRLSAGANDMASCVAEQDVSAAFVYLAHDGQFTKIGFSRDPGRRLPELQTGSARKLSIICQTRGSVKKEKALHTLLSSYRVRGDGEWFNLPPDKLEVVKRLLSIL